MFCIVSFQEHDLHNFTSSSKEFSTIYRRGSVAPLAARIRSNRPPTAPPTGSIYLKDMDDNWFVWKIDFCSKINK